jgi:HEAT repeat protein
MGEALAGGGAGSVVAVSSGVGSCDLYENAIVTGTDEAVASLVAFGPEAVHRLRQHLTGEMRPAIPEGTSDRLVLDNLMWVSHEVAGAYPDEFLVAFANDRWNENPFVCAGLGAIRRREVTERLLHILTSKNHWLRVDAAVALRGHTHPDLEGALAEALDDPDELVRYHVEERLAELRGEP